MHDQGTAPGALGLLDGGTLSGRMESALLASSEGTGSAEPGVVGPAGYVKGRDDTLSEYSRRAIYGDAERASKLGQSIEFACPYPWFTEAGRLWRRTWRKAEAAKGIA